jgi:hypothetical protein
MSIELIAAFIGAIATLIGALLTIYFRNDKPPTAPIVEPKYDWKVNRRIVSGGQSTEKSDLDALHAEIEFRKHPETEVNIVGKNK